MLNMHAFIENMLFTVVFTTRNRKGYSLQALDQTWPGIDLASVEVESEPETMLHSQFTIT